MQLEFNRKFPFIHRATSQGEQRATVNWPSADLSLYFPGSGASYDTDAGVDVTQDTAITLSAVWRAINILSSSIGSLPLQLYRRDGSDRVLVTDHPAARLIKKPNDFAPANIFFETVQASVLSSGNGYAYITRSRAFEPLGLEFIDEGDVTVRHNGGQVFYDVSKKGDGIRSNRILHIPGLSFNGITGKSPIEVAKNSLGGGLAMQKFGNKFFKNGAKQTGILMYPYALSDKARDNLQNKFEKKMASKEGGTMILEEGMKYQGITIPPEQAQFLASRKFSVEEVARWYGIPSYMLAESDKPTYASVEMQGIDFVKYSLMPWIKRWENELNRKLLRPSEQQSYYFKFNVNGLLRGDSKSRGEYYRLMLDMGVLSINEVRQLEEFNNIPGGDKHLVQLARTTLDKVGQDEQTDT